MGHAGSLRRRAFTSSPVSVGSRKLVAPWIGHIPYHQSECGQGRDSEKHRGAPEENGPASEEIERGGFALEGGVISANGDALADIKGALSNGAEPEKGSCLTCISVPKSDLVLDA